MEFKTNADLLKLNPDSLEAILKEYNLDKPGVINDSVTIFRKWIQQQAHFTKTDFSDNYLTTMIIGGKGSIERAKGYLDRICTLRTLLPQCFGNFDIKKDFHSVFERYIPTILPDVTKDNHRVFIGQFINNVTQPEQIRDYFLLSIWIVEYMKACDLVPGFQVVLDCRNVNVMSIINNINPIDLRNFVEIYLGGYGMKMKALHFVTPSKLIDGLVTIIKQILKPKLANRIKVHKDFDQIQDIVGKDSLPDDFGGNGKSMKLIFEKWVDEMSRQDFKDYMKNMNMANTNETLRPSDKFYEKYAGTPGTFRVLSVD